ncbi:MAG: hypothetical protein ACI396_10790 [Acutalibacteraceae bacterium]
MFIFIPVYYSAYEFGDPYAFLRPALLSVHNAFRVFILDGEFDIIKDAVANLSVTSRAMYSFYVALLYVIAPVLTFSNVLSLFKNLKGELRFALHKNRPFYIFSELNEKSIALANSISKRYLESKDKTQGKPVLVFTDVFEKDEESGYELLLKAHDMGAICLKKDIIRINVKRKRARVEFFLIGENESENVEQAIRLNQEYKNCDDKPISIYIYSTKPSAGYVLDSIDKGDYMLDAALTEHIKNDPIGFLEERSFESEQIDSRYYIRRIDNVEMLAVETLTDQKVLDVLFGKSNDKTISIMIIGVGSYGKEFLKNALWLSQVLGYKVEINVFDALYSSNGAQRNLVKSLAQEWPEIIDNTESRSFVRNKKGDSVYDIHIFDGVDCFTSDFDDLFVSGEYKNRLKKTQLAIVSLGDDDKNIEAAVMLRALFDRINSVSNEDLSKLRDDDRENKDLPLIYSVVYDDKKSANLNSNQNKLGIVDYQKDSFHINFIGNLQSQFSYDLIDKQKQLEIKAMDYHLDWLRRDVVNKEHSKQLDINQVFDKVMTKTKAYMNYEYYRKSSISRAVHEKLLQKISKYVVFTRVDEHDPQCRCPICKQASVTEHMRWNAFMRTMGYRYSKNRCDRAKMHNDIVVWDDLNSKEQNKDLNQ